jgi:4-hydroxybenzoyl-CoA reductase subunit beta
MHLDPFELHRPTSVEEVGALARELTGGFDLLAGGTDLLPNYKMHLNLKPHLISLQDVSELSGVSLERIGAMARLADLEADPALGREYPGLLEAVREVATPLVRASATVGGNLLVETRCFFFNQSLPWRASLGYCLKADGDRCHVVPQKERCYATFSGDLAPALSVLDAQVEVAGPSGRRRLPVPDLYDPAGDGIRRHRLAPGEFVVAVHLPDSARGRRARYRKLRVRPSFDFPELGVAAAGRFDGRRPVELRIALGGVETYPRRFDEVTDRLLDGPLTEERIRSTALEIQRQVRPVHNTFLPADYRRRMVEVFVRGVLTDIAHPRPVPP